MPNENQRSADPADGLSVVVRRPLVPLTFCMLVLDKTEDKVMADIEAGRIEWAFNLGRRSCRRRMIRVLTACLQSNGAGLGSKEWTASEVAEACVPSGRVQVPDLCRAWTCSSTGIHQLINDGEFGEVERPPAQSGPLSSPTIPREAAVAFLVSRRVL